MKVLASFEKLNKWEILADLGKMLLFFIDPCPAHFNSWAAMDYRRAEHFSQVLMAFTDF